MSFLGLRAIAGTYVSSTPQFGNGDVFATGVHTWRPLAPAVLEASYSIIETIDLIPEQAYFVDVFADCNDSLIGSWVAARIPTRAS